MTMILVEAVEHWAAALLRRAGLRPEHADSVAATLAFAEARGVPTHGFMRLPIYLDRISSGGINSNPAIRVTHDHGALVVLDADDAPGAASGVMGADLAIERAARHGIGCAIARDANHFGASGYYTNRMADADLLGIAVCNTESVMCAPFGGRPVLGTNPLAVAVPLPRDRRPELDMATTTTSHGRIMMAEQAGKPIPTGWAVDARGRPTESASAGLQGALLPSGGPKGFGIAFAIDALLALGGANTSPEVNALHGDPSRPQKLGQAFIAIRADLAEPLDGYRARIDRMLDAIHASGVDDELPQPMAPGEPELVRTRTLAGRVAFGDGLVATLTRLADAAGVPFPELSAASS